MLYVGIDTGTNTGVAIWDRNDKKLILVDTMQIDQALEHISALSNQHQIFVRFEDARLRKWVTGGREKLQGVGSVKRDCTIWENFLKRKNIPFEAVAPKNNITKMTDAYFKKVTGWSKRTSEHARDATMLVYGK